MLTVTYAECHIETPYAECRYAEFHNAEFRYAECCGAYDTFYGHNCCRVLLG